MDTESTHWVGGNATLSSHLLRIRKLLRTDGIPFYDVECAVVEAIARYPKRAKSINIAAGFDSRMRMWVRDGHVEEECRLKPRCYLICPREDLESYLDEFVPGWRPAKMMSDAKAKFDDMFLRLANSPEAPVVTAAESALPAAQAG